MRGAPDYLKELSNCKLCEWKCGVDRLSGELGVCRMSFPEVASVQLHPAPPQSFTIFLAGCNFKCLNCQNWSISQYPDSGETILGWVDPAELAAHALSQLETFEARRMGADRIFFSGGEPTIHLPYIEKIVEEARRRDPEAKFNYDTNGFLTPQSFERVLSFATSITYDIKAFHDEVHRALTGAPVEPVLRNARILVERAPEKLWEFRILVIPGISESEIPPLMRFLASLDRKVPVCFLAFRPNFVLQDHPGAPKALLDWCVDQAFKAGLVRVTWSGLADLPGEGISCDSKYDESYELPQAKLAATYAGRLGCPTHPRDCGSCSRKQSCPIKRFQAIPEPLRLRRKPFEISGRTGKNGRREGEWHSRRSSIG